MVYYRCWQHAARIRYMGLIQENVGEGALVVLPLATSPTANSDDSFSTVLEQGSPRLSWNSSTRAAAMA